MRLLNVGAAKGCKVHEPQDDLQCKTCILLGHGFRGTTQRVFYWVTDSRHNSNGILLDHVFHCITQFVFCRITDSAAALKW